MRCASARGQPARVSTKRLSKRWQRVPEPSAHQKDAEIWKPDKAAEDAFADQDRVDESLWQ